MLMKTFLEEAKRLIQMNSTPSHGNEELSHYVLTLMQDRGLKTKSQQMIHSQEISSKRQFNLIGILGDTLSDKKIKKGLLLASHLDTPFTGLKNQWKKNAENPFHMMIEEDKIFGLGAADAKIDFLCKLYAVEKFRERKLKQPIYILGTAGKEHAMMGTRYFIKSSVLNPQFVLVGEPSCLQLITSHPGHTVFQISIHFQLMEKDARGFNRTIHLQALGKTGHHALADKGQNALVLGLSFLEMALKKGFDLRFTQIMGGGSFHQIPDESFFKIFIASHQFEDFKKFFRDYTHSFSLTNELKLSSFGVGESGVCFLPENVFPCLMEVCHELNQNFLDDTGLFSPSESFLKRQSENKLFMLTKISEKLSGINLFFDTYWSQEEEYLFLKKKIETVLTKLSRQYPHLNLQMMSILSHPPLKMLSSNDTWIKLCQESLKAVGLSSDLCISHPFSTEASLYQEFGYSVLGFGPGNPLESSYRPQEHVLLAECEKAIAFYEQVIQRVCVV